EINQQLNEPPNIINTAEKSLDIYSHMFEKAQSIPEREVYTS
ncbi:6785_t:CDS:1, partial [Cetraspora pellucida]